MGVFGYEQNALSTSLYLVFAIASGIIAIIHIYFVRKLKILLKRKDAVKDKKNLYGFVRGPGYEAINKVRLQNIEKLSKAISRINNIIFFIAINIFRKFYNAILFLFIK